MRGGPWGVDVEASGMPTITSRLLAPLLTALLLGTLLPTPAAAQAAAPPEGDISDGVTFVGNAPEASTAIALAFDGDVMFVSTITGIFSYDVTDPSAPRLLGVLPEYIWENEDMELDAERDLLFISRDPRGFTGIIAPAQARLFGAVEIVDVSDPSLMHHVGAFTLPAGHTSSCVSAGESRCDFLWTGGPYANELLGPYGRPIYATDVRDPANPVPCPEPINTGLYDTADGELVDGYAHDVQVDDRGVAWVSSEGGVHGWWTSGAHLDPRTGEERQATPCDPVPYGGAGSPQEATPSRFMHNSGLNPDVAIPGDADSAGHVLFATEEALSSSCATSGRFATYDVRSTLDGSGFTDPAGTRLEVLDTWTPEDAEGATGCASAHYFDDRGDGLLAYSFYGQGTRFLDASDPTDIRQVGYYRPDDGNSFAAYFHDGLVYVADNGRGVDILRFDPHPRPGAPVVHADLIGTAAEQVAPAALPTVTAPPWSVAAQRLWQARHAPDPDTARICLLAGRP